MTFSRSTLHRLIAASLGGALLLSARATLGAPQTGATGSASTPSDPPRSAQCEPCEPADEEERAEGAGQFLVGAALLDFSELNDRLSANGYEKLDSLVTILGGEGHGVMESGFIAGARGGAILGRKADAPGGLTASVGGGFGMLDFGFALVHSRNILLSLTGGVGGYGLSLNIVDERSDSFDAVLGAPNRSVSLGRGGLLVGLTLGVDGRVPVGEPKHGRTGFFTLGLRVGGLYGPPLGGWETSGGGDASDGPSFGLTGGWAALAIGFGGGPVPTR